MRVSDDAIERSAPLIAAYLQCMDELNVFRRSCYPEISESRTLGCETIRVLIQYQFDRSIGAYCLIVNGPVWDAEIILRTVYETSAKVLLLAASSQSVREGYAEEFWTKLSAIYDRKGAARAGLAKRLMRESGYNDVRIFEALQNSKLFSTDLSGNKRSRDEVEQRWSFSSIVKILSQSSSEHVRVEGLDALTHMYGIMSHLAHASPKALELMQDRATRQGDLVLLEARVQTHLEPERQGGGERYA